MDELNTFVRAALDRVERAALAATAGPWRYDPTKHHRKPGTVEFSEGVFTGASGRGATCIAVTGETDDPQSMADAEHIALHDPASELADVAAKRAILEEHQRIELTYWPTAMCGVCADPEAIPVDDPLGSDGPWVPNQAYPCRTVQLLAQAYAGQPGWREEWRA